MLKPFTCFIVLSLVIAGSSCILLLERSIYSKFWKYIFAKGLTEAMWLVYKKINCKLGAWTNIIDSRLLMGLWDRLSTVKLGKWQDYIEVNIEEHSRDYINSRSHRASSSSENKICQFSVNGFSLMRQLCFDSMYLMKLWDNKC